MEALGRRGAVRGVACGSDVLGCHSLFLVEGAPPSEGEKKRASTASAAAEAASIDRRNSGDETQSPPPVDAADANGAASSQLWMYGSGVGTALGRPSGRSEWRPALVWTSEMHSTAEGGPAMVAAGGGFSLALTKGGSVFSWGKRSNGRLGRGPPPVVRTGGGRGS